MKFNYKENGSSFVKLKDGESVTGVFVGDPFEFKTHWENNKTIFCTNDHTCVLCDEGNKASFRFRLKFAENVSGSMPKYSPKIFEQGYRVYENLRDISDSEIDLESSLVKVSRFGSGTDTRYVISVLKQISNLDQLAISEIRFPEVTANLVSREIPATAQSDNDDIPF